MRKGKISLLEWVLRIGVCGTYLGHGTYALLVKPQWIKLITSIGPSVAFATKAMPVIGVVDYIVALWILLRPNKLVLIWATIWCTLTALSRVTAGESALEVLERFANIACPLALLFVQQRGIQGQPIVKDAVTVKGMEVLRENANT